MNYVILASGSVILILVSWFLSIKYKRYHGIARFFAFECVFLLGFLNIDVWFNDPFSLLQIISWTFLILSAYVVTTGYYLLSRLGKPGKNFENTSVIVKSGIYKYIRHPLYLSILLLGTGIVLKDPAPLQLILGLINMIAVIVTAIIEEKEMIEKFGDDYKEYMKTSWRFFPYIF